MENMYERIKKMTPEEMRQFVYWVYLCGNRDGECGQEDSPDGFFGGAILAEKANEVIPNDSTDDLWDMFKATYGR